MDHSILSSHLLTFSDHSFSEHVSSARVLSEREKTVASAARAIVTHTYASQAGIVGEDSEGLTLHIRSENAKAVASTPMLPVDSTLPMLEAYLNEWAENCAQRKRVCREMIEFLFSSKDSLIIVGSVFPDIFHIQLFVDRLSRLVIHGLSPHRVEFPESIYCLINLRHLHVRNFCLDKIPNVIGNLRLLISLSFEHCLNLVKVDKSINQLSQLTSMRFSECPVLTTIPQFTNHLVQLTDLYLSDCAQLAQVPESIGLLVNLQYLSLDRCYALTELPESIGQLTRLIELNLSGNYQLEPPLSLYMLALKLPSVVKHPGVKRASHWMSMALRGRIRAYEVNREENQLKIEIRRDTLIPFARQHLKLLIEAIGPQDYRQPNWVPCRSSVCYVGSDGRPEVGIDAGGVSRDFWDRCIPNIAQQIAWNHPILKRLASGYYILEKEMGRPMTREDTELCENIGKLLSLFVAGFGEHHKLGAVFPEHFYSALAYLYSLFHMSVPSNREWDLYPCFENNHIQGHMQLCSLLAVADKEGIKDKNGHLFFDMHEKVGDQGRHKRIGIGRASAKILFPDVLDAGGFTDSTLYKIWRILNVQVDEDEVQRIFSKLSDFFCIEEMPTGEDGQYFADTFTNYLKNEQHKDQPLHQFVAEAVMQYAYDTYHRQCDPLIAVMRGFKNVPHSKILPILFVFDNYQDLQDASQGRALSGVIQGATFTREAFVQLMGRCVNESARAYRAIVQEKMDWLREWYVAEATEQEMKDLVRCMNGAEVITAELKLKFNGQQGSLSVFHTCSGSVNMGSLLLAETDKNTFINYWKKNVDWALRGAGFNVL